MLPLMHYLGITLLSSCSTDTADGGASSSGRSGGTAPGLWLSCLDQVVQDYLQSCLVEYKTGGTELCH